MKTMREFSDEPGRYIPSAENAIRRIEKLPLPYTGNKKKLAYPIYEALNKHHVEFDSVLDAFTGSATVAYLFKLMGKKVLANDLLTSSYINAVAFVENPGIQLSEDDKHFLLYNQNTSKNTFVEDNYLAIQDRPKGKKCRANKFTIKECRHLDNFRANIDELVGLHAQGLGLAANAAVVMRLPFGNIDQSIDIMSHRKKQNRLYGKGSDKHDRRIGIYYDDDLNLNFNKWFIKYANDFMVGGSKISVSEAKIKRASFLANLQQHVFRDCVVGGRMHKGQVLAEVEVRLKHPKNQIKATYDNNMSTEMDFFTQAGKPGQGMKWWTFADMKLPGTCLAVNMDLTCLLQSGFCSVDAVYFDPPYSSSTNYPTLYRFFEEYIYSEELENLPHIMQNGHRFTKSKSYESDFVEMVSSAIHIPIWLFSYNDSSWSSIEHIYDIIKQYKEDVVVEILDGQYRYLYRKKQGRENKSREYLIIAKNKRKKK